MGCSVVFISALAVVLAASAYAGEGERWNLLMVQADTQDQLGNYARAAELYREAIRVAEPLHDLRYAQALDGLANVADEMGRYPEAERLFLKARALVSAAGKDSNDYAVVTVNLGMHYVETGQAGKGEKLIREAIACFQRMTAPDERRFAQSLNGLAVMLVGKGKYQEAEVPLLQALEVFKKLNEPGNAKLAVAISNLGAIRQMQGRLPESVQLFEQSIAMLDTELGVDHPLILRSLNNLGMVQTLLKHPEAAENAFRRAIRVAGLRQVTEQPFYARLLLNYAAAKRRFGDKRAAKELEIQAKAVFRDTQRTNGVGMTVDAAAFRSDR